MEKKQASDFYQHFDVNERSTVDFFVGLFNRYLFQNDPILTPFLNPREVFIFKKIVGNCAQVLTWGGYQSAEKVRLLLCDWEESFLPEKFDIAVLEISYNKKWEKITHSQILGVLANSGIEVNTVGDIISDGKGNWQFFIEKQLVKFVEQEVTKIGHAKVKLHEISEKEILQVNDDSEERSAVVVSLRLDTVVSSIINQSRSHVKASLKEKNIKLNWHDIKESHIMISREDILSIRHFGRVKINEIFTTKKGKYRINYQVWQSKKR
ncbi:RNA-binding protein [Lactobacillus sp. PV037]|nr:RNA-binding protein [Lactobacillus sp. PV012]QNQ84427.1 RNA-binding protein [Lactobacillus sp. PV037]